MESQPQNPEFRINPENFNPCFYKQNSFRNTLRNSMDPDSMSKLFAKVFQQMTQAD